MKRVLIVLILSLMVLSTQAFSAEKQFGIGIGGGNIASGLSGKYIMGGNTALQGIIGVRGNEGFALGIDFIINMPPDLVKNSDVKLSWYVGAGGSWWHYSNKWGNEDFSWEILGINGVLGLSLMLQKVPLEFSIEWRPVFFISTSSHDWYDGYDGLYPGGAGASIRWFF